MPTVNIDKSAGYGRRGPTDTGGGTVYAPEWAVLNGIAGGNPYGVIGDSWRITAGAADREIVISPGSGFGWGVLDTTTEPARMQLPAPSSGTSRHLIVVHRDWQNRKSSFRNIAGPDSFTLPTRESTYGVVDDQPIGLVAVRAGSAQIITAETVDLRVWPGPGGVHAVNELVVQYLDQVGTCITIDGTTWRRDIGPAGAVWTISRSVNIATDNNIVSGAGWDGSSPILSLYLSGNPQVDQNGVTTLALPIGGFQNGVLHVSPQILSGNSAKMCTVSEVGRTFIRLQLLDEFGKKLPQGTAVPLSVRVDGW